MYFDNDPYNSQLKRYSKACGSYHEFRDWLLLIRNLLNHGFLLVATLNSSRKGGYFCNGGRAFICVYSVFNYFHAFSNRLHAQCPLHASVDQVMIYV